MPSVPGTLSFPAGWEFVGSAEFAITTQGVTIDLTTISGVSSTDKLRVEYLALGDMIQADTWSNTGAYVRTRTQNGAVSSHIGLPGGAPREFISKSSTVVLAVSVWKQG